MADSNGEYGDDESASTQIMTPEEIAEATAGVPASSGESHSAQLVIIGSGPGGYTAAFRAADLGMEVILVERWPMIGGVCLNVGCIPSKALLHAARVIDEAKEMAEYGVVFGKPKIDASKLLDWKNQVVNRLVGGLDQLAKQRKVKIVHGVARFESANKLVLDNGDTITFEKCIIAAGPAFQDQIAVEQALDSIDAYLLALLIKDSPVTNPEIELAIGGFGHRGGNRAGTFG